MLLLGIQRLQVLLSSFHFSLFQVVGQWGRSPENVGERRAGSAKSGIRYDPVGIAFRKSSIVPTDQEPGTDQLGIDPTPPRRPSLQEFNCYL